LDGRKSWYLPGAKTEDESATGMMETDESKLDLPVPDRVVAPAAATLQPAAAATKPADRRMEIVPVEGGLDAVISELKSKP
jgi:hypothetical protein